MIKKKFVAVTIGILFCCLGWSTTASAAVKGNPNDLKIDSTSNKEAIAFVENQSGLENTPVPVENLTTQQPKVSSLLKTRSIARAQYYYDDTGFVDNMIQYRCNYLVPTGFSWLDNGIPRAAIIEYLGTAIFSFNSNIYDTNVGGYGTGGWYWRQFKSNVNGRWVYYWLSTWNLNYLLTDGGNAGIAYF